MARSSRTLVLQAPAEMIYNFVEKGFEDIFKELMSSLTTGSPKSPHKHIVNKDPPTKMESFADFGWGRTIHLIFNFKQLTENLTEVRYIVDIGGMYEFLYGIKAELLMDSLLFISLKSFEAGYISQKGNLKT